jgi:hypothetical protein
MFEDFTEPQLQEIFERKLKDQDLSATDKAKQVALGVLSRKKHRPNFGNGGEVENMLTFAKDRYLKRKASKPSNLSLDIVFEPEDFDPNMCSSVICHYTSIAQSPTLTTNGIPATSKAKCPLWSWAVAEVPAVRVCSHCTLLDGRSESVTSRNTSRTRTWRTRCVLFVCCVYLLLQ